MAGIERYKILTARQQAVRCSQAAKIQLALLHPDKAAEVEAPKKPRLIVKPLGRPPGSKNKRGA